MTPSDHDPVAHADPAAIAAAAGDDAAVAALLERHRREIHVHCYRMLGSFDEAEDVLQEAYLRAWDRRRSFGRELNFRAWLYRIATNACLDTLRRSKRRAPSLRTSFAEIPWLQPYPDQLLDEVAPREQEPDAVVFARETIELAFLAVIQLLPARQRAVLIMRDVLDWPAADTAELLEMSVPAVNSALQRARATLAEHPRPATAAASPTSATRDPITAGAATEHEQDLLRRFIDAHEHGDAQAALAAVRDDIRITMPPHPFFYEGREAMTGLLATAFGDEVGDEWRLVPTAANRMPTAASYCRRRGDSVFRAFKFDVLRVEGDRIAEITTFGPGLFEAFGLPETLPP